VQFMIIAWQLYCHGIIPDSPPLFFAVMIDN